MKNKIKSVKSGDCFTASQNDPAMLYTTYLGEEIAVAFWFRDLNLAILGRCLTKDQLKNILERIATENHNSRAEVTVVGGDDSLAARANLEEVIQVLNEAEHGQFTINVLANDALHPDFCILSHETGFTY